MVKKLRDKKDILRVFDINSWNTIKKVSKKIGLSYQPSYTYLNELSKEGYLNHKREGNVHLYSINLENEFVVKELENFEFEKMQNFMENLDRKINSGLNEFIREMQKLSLWLVLLFGSTARKSRTEKSDIDILVVGNNENRIKRISNTINMKYNLNISPVVVSVKEFRKMLIERNKFIQNLLNEKIILYGFEFFYNELIKSMEELKWI